MGRSVGDPEQARRRARGSVLAEFALLGFVVWMLLAGVLEIGRALTAQQLIQHASRTMAREMARVALPPEISFEDAVASDAFRRDVLDPRFLVIDSELLSRCDFADFGEPGHEADLDALFAGRPVGNRLLRPLMIADRRGGERMIRYPGTLLLRNASPGPDCEDGSRYVVGIAELESAAGRVRWHAVVEPHVGAPGGVARDFALSDGGWVGLRLNYPFQSAGLLAAEATGVADPQTGRETQRFVDADAALVDDRESFDALEAATFVPSPEEGGVYAGLRGLGRLYAGPNGGDPRRAVRPYRRLLSANAGFRREIFRCVPGVPC